MPETTVKLSPEEVKKAIIEYVERELQVDILNDQVPSIEVECFLYQDTPDAIISPSIRCYAVTKWTQNS